MKKNIMIFISLLIIYNSIMRISCLSAGVIELFVIHEWFKAIISILFILIYLIFGTVSIGMLISDIKDKINEGR